MKTKTYIVEMPEGWGKMGFPRKYQEIFKALAHAKPAVEITTDHMETYEGKDTGGQTINGKSVKLYAVEDK